MPEDNSEYPTTIGADAVFKGQLQFKKGVRLMGKFEGEITSGGQLLVAEGASLSGDVQASTIRIDGTVKGNLTIEAKVQLTGSARLEGDVKSARLEVAEGAVLIGMCTVGVTEPQKANGAPKSMPTASVAPSKGKGVAVAAGGRR